MRVKQWSRLAASLLVKPGALVGRFLIRWFLLPVYRRWFQLQRFIASAIGPAKKQLIALVANRYAVHVVVMSLVIITSVVNISGGEVRAESFGKQSMLYGLVSGEDSAVVEVVSSSGTASLRPSSYVNDVAISPDAHADALFFGDAFVSSATGSAVDGTVQVVEEIPSGRTEVTAYTVKDGDTLWSIATRYHVTVSTILWANNLTVKSVIKPGVDLKIPPVDGVLYTVKKGDTLGGIAKSYQSDSDEILAFNNLDSANDISIGATLILPGGEPPAPIKTRTAPVASVFTPAPVKTPTTTTVSAPPDVSAETSTNTRGSSTGKGNWVWPTDWRVITQYYGWKHTGVDIDGDYTTFSYAAADGIVIYSGWRNGYGNCVEVDHGNGLVTRYAHHSKNFVKVGDVVTAGQALAQTGTTGRSTGTHLHFEVIKNGKFQNPLDYVR